MITKLDDREAGVRFVNPEYDYRPTSDDTKSHYQLIISITISDSKCPITCKCPINALLGEIVIIMISINIITKLGSCFRQVEFDSRLAVRGPSVLCDGSTSWISGLSGGLWAADNDYRILSIEPSSEFLCRDSSIQQSWSAGGNTFAFTFPHAGPWEVM